MSLTVAESAAIVGELRRARRQQRVAAIHWVDALYQVYVTGLVAVVTLVLVSGAIGDDELTGSAIDDVIGQGPAVLGVAAALAVLMGLRSGSRGGPLALEKPDVRHVLLSPVDRGVALRGPTWRQLRFLALIGAGVGAVAGQLALRRLPGNPAEWLLAGAAFGLTVVGLGFGSALVASGVGLRSWVATLVGGVLVAWSVGDVVGTVPAAPGSAVGHLGVLPLEVDPLAALGPVVAVVALVAGFRLVANASLEAAERRTALVGQLRFAVTLQDLRTVLVLRRQLAQETPRSRPWIRARSRAPRFPVWNRGLRSFLRWPVSRIVRVLVLAVVAGLSMRGVWAGTTPLIVLAGISLWIAALDAAEALGQEVDHPGRTDSFPLERGELLLRHLPIVAAISCATGLLAGAVAALPVGAAVPLAPALITGFAAGALAASGAAISIVQGAPDPVDALSMVTPEIAGIRTVYRTVWPPTMAVIGTLPLLAARAAERGISDPPPYLAAVNISVLLAILVVLVGGWVRFRDDIRAWIATANEQMSPSKVVERQREERLAEEAREAEALRAARRLAGQDPDGDDGDDADGDDPDGSGRAAARPDRHPKPKTSTQISPPPPGVRGGTSAKPIGRRRDQQ